MRKRYKKFYRIRRKKSVLRSRIFWRFFLLFAVIGSVSYFAFFSSFFQIKEITISGDVKIPAYEIKDSVGAEIDKDFVFAKSKSIFLVSLEEINKKITEQFPQIAKISLKRIFPDVLAVDVIQRKPIANWCQEGSCFYLDQEGVIFEETQSKTGLRLMPEDNSAELEAGVQIIDKKYLSRILDIAKQIESHSDIGIKEIVVFDEARKIKIISAEGWHILFDLDESVSTQASNLFVVLEETIPVSKRKNLDYVDLRFGNRIYWKYK